MRFTNLENANKKLSRKIFLFWGITFTLFLISLPDFWISKAIAIEIATYFPVVKGQLEKGTGIGLVAARFFAFGVLVIPMGTLFLLWGQDLRSRIELGVASSGGRWKFLFTGLFLGVPFCTLMLVLIYFSPIELPKDPRLHGQILAHAMTNTYWGLAVFGSVGIVAVTLIFFMLICFLAAPILFIFKKKRE